MTNEPRTAVRRLAAARLISITGGAAAYMALNFSIYERTGSATWVAAALFLTFGTLGFTSPFAGLLGDRFDRRRVMIVSELLGAAAFGVMALVSSPALLLAVAFCSALVEAPFFSASMAAIPNLVEEKDLGWANGLVALGRNAGIVVGPIIGGLLVVSVGAGAVFAMNAVTFVVSAAMIATVRGRFNGDRSGAEEFKGLRAGFRFLLGQRLLRTVVLVWVPVVLGLGMSMVADVPFARLFGTGSFGYGLLVSCWGAGSIVGSLVGRYLRADNEVRAFVAGTALVGGMAVVMGLSPWWVLALTAVLVMGVGDGLSLVAEQGILQRSTPDAVRSRVAGAVDTVLHGGLAISYALAGPAVEWLGPRGVYVVGGVATFVGVGLALPVLYGRRRRGADSSSRPIDAEDGASLLVG